MEIRLLERKRFVLLYLGHTNVQWEIQSSHKSGKIGTACTIIKIIAKPNAAGPVGDPVEIAKSTSPEHRRGAPAESPLAAKTTDTFSPILAMLVKSHR